MDLSMLWVFVAEEQGREKGGGVEKESKMGFIKLVRLHRLVLSLILQQRLLTKAFDEGKSA